MRNPGARDLSKYGVSKYRKAELEAICRQYPERIASQNEAHRQSAELIARCAQALEPWTDALMLNMCDGVRLEQLPAGMVSRHDWPHFFAARRSFIVMLDRLLT